MSEAVNAAKRTRRAEKAQETYRRIVEAATRLFLDRGYVPTTIEAIADAADVAVETVYARFRTKANLMVAVKDAAVTEGGDIPLARRPELAALTAETDQRRSSGSHPSTRCCATPPPPTTPSASPSPPTSTAVATSSTPWSASSAPTGPSVTASPPIRQPTPTQHWPTPTYTYCSPSTTDGQPTTTRPGSPPASSTSSCQTPNPRSPPTHISPGNGHPAVHGGKAPSGTAKMSRRRRSRPHDSP